MYQRWLIALASLSLSICTTPAWAVKAATWTHEQPSEFTAGELQNLVVTSEGEVQLARQHETLFVPGEDAEVINALAQAGDGKLYAATGPKGIIYRIDGEKVDTFATLPDGGTVFSLLFTEAGQLLAGTGGGGQAKIYRIDGNGKASLFYEPQGTRYIWALARGPAGKIYAATGVEGKLYVIEADGATGRQLADLKPKNLLCLAFGGDGMLYGGTDEDGLIYRINPASGKAYVLYDAPEPEISSIVLDASGNIFAATATASGARPGRSISDVPGGRPEAGSTSPTTSQPASGVTAAPEAQEDDSASGSDDEGKPTTAPTTPPKPRRIGTPPTPPSKKGNAIYRIDIDGFVTEIFREPVMILALAESAGTLYAATGNEGRIYSINPVRERTVVLAKLPPTQLTCLLRLTSGELILGSANEAMLIRMSEDYAKKGTLTSKPLDAEQIVKWGRLSWEATVPEGTKLTVATRSGNVADEESDIWEAWSGEMDATAPQQVASAGARFLQYRLTLETTVTGATPSLRKLKIARIEENRAPKISALQALPVSLAAKAPGSPPKVKSLAAMGRMESEEAQPDHQWVAVWKAEDPNKDEIEYEVFYRPQGQMPWIRMAKEQEEAFYIWDTRTVPDGTYEVRVRASDKPSNPPGTELDDARISDPVIVDNTPPEVTLGAVAVEGKDRLTVNASMKDASSFIVSASYTIDSHDEWIPLAPLDDIFDSPSEAVSFTIDDLDPGPHRIALRVADEQGNTRYVTQSATIGQ